MYTYLPLVSNNGWICYHLSIFSLIYFQHVDTCLSTIKVDSSRQLDRVSRLQLYQYRYKDGVMSEKTAADCTRQVGVLAQELRQVIPDAVHETVSVLMYM